MDSFGSYPLDPGSDSTTSQTVTLYPAFAISARTHSVSLSTIKGVGKGSWKRRPVQLNEIARRSMTLVSFLKLSFLQNFVEIRADEQESCQHRTRDIVIESKPGQLGHYRVSAMASP